MKTLKTVTDVVTLPARVASHAAAATLGTAVGAAGVGARAAGQVVGWAVDRAAGERTRPPAAEEPTPVRTPASTAPARKATAKKAPARKAPARRRAPSKKAAVMAPALGLTEAEAEDVLRTPSGIPAAGDGINPDTTETDLHQPGTEPLMDPATVKAVKSESEVLRRAADTDKG